jgi:large conductance mechanosensitive channel
MGLVSEFKEFAIKGNVIDLAVGVIIGGAFGKIVNSVVNDILMPPLGYLISGFDFKNIKIILANAIKEGDKVIKPEISLNLGMFLQNVFEFLIIAFCVFLFVKAINKLKRKEEEVAETPPKTEDVLLLEEIRDLLKQSK